MEEMQEKVKSVTEFNTAARCARAAWRYGCVTYALQSVTQTPVRLCWHVHNVPERGGADRARSASATTQSPSALPLSSCREGRKCKQT